MKKIVLNRSFVRLFVLMAVFFLGISFSYAQPDLPQRAVSVTATQSIHFGTFCLTGAGGGTVVLGYDGSLNSTGDIFLSALAPVAQPAIFDIKLCQGRNVTITYDPTTTLTGSNGGSFTLDIGPTEKGVSGSVFPVNNDCNFITTLRVGGTLNIPGSSPSGTYTGSFSITFEQE
ncbi:MAG: DUF4402 domain-containing protein [Prolixibacteraceae bacterium]|jgi:hypothetical protein|nr:DUF4402 domain-containing protein [Prolixibacteraceae bacterium]MBT6007262.1 DUF4402 domain-containing protein [Prolixibacteraceae bacterium]MBT6763175.1 DUF4402 domain-containing protein [Prolixibacteraceae bacterium]MBT6998378.1 DUF4402 domain-containing protein [Prolixibacteraceae bacterium]MBT7394097.1 DUF4402 domain-containing protein [Prolixibacteraceae bacterium]